MENTVNILLNLLGISQSDYLHLVRHYGVEYAKHMWGRTPEFMAEILQTNAYWKWWNGQFRSRTRRFVYRHGINTIQPGDPLVSAAVMWLLEDAHSPESVHTYPDRVLMMAIEAEMIGNVIDEVNQNRTRPA